MTTELTREQVENFLFLEAELLDEWKLNEWAALYAEDALYEVTSPASEDPLNSDAEEALFLISDRIDRIRGRAVRLLKKTAHAEYPHSKTRHMISNVRLLEQSETTIKLRANTVVFRTKEDNTSFFMGEAWYTLARTNDGLKLKHKRVILDLNSLYGQGRLTIIL